MQNFFAADLFFFPSVEGFPVIRRIHFAAFCLLKRGTQHKMVLPNCNIINSRCLSFIHFEMIRKIIKDQKFSHPCKLHSYSISALAQNVNEYSLLRTIGLLFVPYASGPHQYLCLYNIIYIWNLSARIIYVTLFRVQQMQQHQRRRYIWMWWLCAYLFASACVLQQLKQYINLLLFYKPIYCNHIYIIIIYGNMWHIHL